MDQGGDKNYWQNDDEQTSVQPAVITEVPQPEILAEPDAAALTWEASEDIHHEKNALWFVGLAVICIILLAISILLIKSWTFAILIVVMAVAVVVLSSRTPQVMQYKLDHHGIQINEKTFNLHDFRAFGVLQEGGLYSIVLIPLKRFMPSVNVYFPAEQGEHIVDVFGEVLPMEQVEPDLLDKLTRKLHI